MGIGPWRLAVAVINKLVKRLTRKLAKRQVSVIDIVDLLNQFHNGVYLYNIRGEKQFIALGRSNDYDTFYGAQCMDWVLYWSQYLGLPLLSASDALHSWNINPDPSKYTKIPYAAGVLPRPGDITVWGSYMGEFGHIDIVVDQISNNGFRGSDQNWYNSNSTVGSPAAYVNHSYAGILGWFRPVIETPQPKPPPIPISSSDS